MKRILIIVVVAVLFVLPSLQGYLEFEDLGPEEFCEQDSDDYEPTEFA